MQLKCRRNREPEQGSVHWDGADLLFCHCCGTLHAEKEQMSIIFFICIYSGLQFLSPCVRRSFSSVVSPNSALLIIKILATISNVFFLFFFL